MCRVLRSRAVVAMLVWFSAVFACHARPIPGIVTNWGDTSGGLTNVPGVVVLTNTIVIACGLSNNLALRADGTMLGWGAGVTDTGIAPNYGQSIIPTGLGNVTAIAAGNYHTLALSNGIVLSWGYNGDGQTNVPPGLTGVMAIAAGSSHSLALESNGSVVAWGADTFNQTNVPAGLSGVAAISAGDIHSMALQSNGTVAVWGADTYGQTNIPPDPTNAVAIAAGMDHCLALRADGTVVAWGFDGFGETNVPTGLSNVVAIAAGGHTSVAVTANGLVTAWGAISNSPTGVTNVETTAFDGGHGLILTLNPLSLSQPPPEIFLAPVASTNIGISVWSGTALNYQWYFDGAPIAHSTNNNIGLIDFALTNAGAYTVTASNAYNYLTDSTILRLSNSPVVLVNGTDLGGGTTNISVSAQITMTNTGDGTAIYYTLDGSTPDFSSTAYSTPFTITNSAIVTAIAYDSAYTASAESASINVQISPIFPLSVTTPGGGSVAASPSPYSGSNYVSNTLVTLTATPATGWTFLEWNGDISSTNPVTTLSMNAAHSVQAIFGTPLDLAVVGNGQLLLNPSNTYYPYGSAVEITAMPAAGSYFFGWADSASGFANPLAFNVTTVDGTTTLFKALSSNQVTLFVSPSGNGTVTVIPATNIFTNGETVTLTAVPTTNSTFSAWGGAVPVTTTNPLTTVLEGNETMTATFSVGAQTNPPVITQPPLSRTLSLGANTLLSFQATGTEPFTYQWLFNSAPISGATNATLLLTNIAPAQAGIYGITLTGVYGVTNSPPISVAILSLVLAPSESQNFPLLILDGGNGASFQLQWSSNLATTNWNLLDEFTLEGNEFYYVDTASSTNPVRFYRAVPQ